MPNLLVEIGNTALKASWSDKMTLGKTFRYQGEKKTEFIISLVEKEKPVLVVLASVYDVPAAEERRIRKACPHLLLLDPSHRDILEGYGMSECSPVITSNTPEDHKAGSIGRPLPNAEIKIENNEILVRGSSVMKGYYKMPEATAETIDKNGYLHSGDLGVKDENGNFRITGRIKDMIIRGGENIYPKEIEEFLAQMPEIKDIQVAAVKSERYGEITGAFIILHEGKTLTEQDVIEFCRDKLSKFKWPQLVMFMDEFPMTGSGKIQKFKLTEIGTKYRREVLKVED